MWWIYVLGAFVWVWLFTSAMLRAKRNYFLFYVCAFLPFMIVGIVILLSLLLVLFPLIYLILFIYSFFAPSMSLNYVFKKIHMGKGKEEPPKGNSSENP
jgi:predicted membrane protein